MVQAANNLELERIPSLEINIALAVLWPRLLSRLDLL